MHRAYRHLSVLLAKSGLHVLRFDYYGCGDSSGEFEDADVEHWLSDLSVAIDEIKDAGGLSTVSLIGFRLGASLAALASTTRTDISRLVLWDPVVNGKQYIAELRESHGEWRRNHLPGAADVVSDNGQAKSENSGKLEIIGFPISPKLHDGLEGIDLLKIKNTLAEQIHIFDSLELRKNTDLRDHFASLKANVNYEFVSGSQSWSQSGGSDALSIPDSILQSIVTATIGE